MAEKICPCCGKELRLSVPQEKYFPNTVGRSRNGTGICIVNNRRYSSYTACHYNSIVNNGETLDFAVQKDISPDWRFAIYYGSSFYPFVGAVRPLHYIEKAIEKGGAALYGDIWFMCESCKCRLAVNYNPKRKTGIIGYALVFLLVAWLVMCPVVFFAFMLGGHFSLVDAVWISAAALALIALTGFLSWLIPNRKIEALEQCQNNFVLTDDDDNLIKPDIDFYANAGGIIKRYCRESNVLSAELNGEKYYLYIAEISGGRIGFSVCGINGEDEAMKAKLREALNSGNAAPALMFGDVSAGSAEVTEITD